MNGRRIYWPRGKTLGGSSSINGLIYIRGQREDYDHWAALGNAGWGYDDVLPYFIQSEGNQRGADAFHGGDGPLKVSDIGAKHELIEAFIDGAQQIGVPRTDDFNGAAQEGAGYYQLTTHKGWRCSTAKAYLEPAKSRRQPAHRDRRAGRRPDVRRPPRRRRALPARRRGEDRALPRRGAALRRRDPVAAVAAALGHRPARAARRTRHPRRARAARRRREPAGPSADPPRATSARKPDHHQRPAQLLDRPGEASACEWLLHRTGAAGDRHQPGRLLHARARRCGRQTGGRHARHPVPRRHAVGRHGRRQGASLLGLHAVGLPAAAGVARPHPHPLARPGRAARDAAQLPRDRARPRAPRWPA